MDKIHHDGSRSRPHFLESARGAAASRAEKNGIPIDIILKTAHWIQESTLNGNGTFELQGIECIIPHPPTTNYLSL